MVDDAVAVLAELVEWCTVDALVLLVLGRAVSDEPTSASNGMSNLPDRNGGTAADFAVPSAGVDAGFWPALAPLVPVLLEPALPAVAGRWGGAEVRFDASAKATIVTCYRVLYI